MGKVLEIGIASKKGDQIKNVDKVEAVKGKGLINDRKFKDNNHKESQITLIEIENIDQYNKTTRTNISALDFLRNIVTKGIKLNALVGKKFFIGEVEVKGHDLCRPCKNLQDSLQQKNTIKELLDTGGLRCEILTTGRIHVGDLIEE